jgi:hypothetical protein
MRGSLTSTSASVRWLRDVLCARVIVRMEPEDTLLAGCPGNPGELSLATALPTHLLGGVDLPTLRIATKAPTSFRWMRGYFHTCARLRAREWLQPQISNGSGGARGVRN